ncbi:SGNH/GDSL hydrolase family protein [uncultured Arcticibacterium sp.]|uniref:SGNH/GDSL hydrolase family protein n=1 Tax=uncultured Arcticibacterium sp. TaxID=2173042 RepID=UPI0030FC6F91
MTEEYEVLVEELEDKLQGHKVERGKTVFYGSSSFRLWENVNKDLADNQIINLAFGGSTMEACQHYFERIVLPYAPSKMVIYAGDNDIGNGRSADQILESFVQLHQKIRSNFKDIPVTFVSIKPSPSRWDEVEKIKDTNRKIKRFINADSHCKYIDIFQPMLDENKKVKEDLFIEDGLHMNEAGYAIWSEVMTGSI